MSEHLEDQNGQEAIVQEGPSSAERCLIFEFGDLPLFLSTKYIAKIINSYSVTHLPLVPPSVKGIISLRRQILPVVNIRVCMDKPEAEYTNKTCAAVLNVDDIPLGIVVDSARQIMDINLDHVCPIPLKRQQKLLNGMIMAKDGSVLMSFDCVSPASCRY